jgi:hypothetical protein
MHQLSESLRDVGCSADPVYGTCDMEIKRFVVICPPTAHVISCSVAWQFDHSFLEMTTNAVVSSSVDVIVGKFRFENASGKAL